ncbi:WXG100 family type VII secretion target [Streptomyces sp. XH2]|uniref:WXG100 family type VII secretion target n=1 Tax=Streptomyces sp. XH2 TaxID=3412483 RepID=UPI003C7A7D4B
MPDIAVDYELLYDVAKQARSLKDQVQEARTRTPDASAEDLGSPGARTAVRQYYVRWRGAFRDSEEKLDKLGELYDNVAKGWFDWDARHAKAANEQGAAIAADLWKGQKSAWDAWQKLVAEGKVDPNDPDAPKNPGDRPAAWTTQDANGNSTTTTYTYDGDRLSSVTTTVTSKSGLTSTETTTYRPDGTYESRSTDGAGNVTVSNGRSTTTDEPDGRKTTTNTFDSTTTDTDGKKTTTKGDTTSVFNPQTGERTSRTTYTTTGPDKNGKERTVKGTIDTTVDNKGHETTTTVEIKSDGSGTKTVEDPDGRTEKWVSSSAAKDTGWRLES